MAVKYSGMWHIVATQSGVYYATTARSSTYIGDFMFGVLSG